MGTFGGRQPNAGRKRKAEKFAGPIDQAERKIADHLPELIDLKFALARGVLVERYDIASGEMKVYQTPPDSKSIEYLLDRIMGKPTERVEVDDVGRMSDEELVAAVTGIVRGDVPEGAEDPGDGSPDSGLS